MILTSILITSAIYTVKATTKGLNQIVTPDIQPLGQLSLSLQMQDAAIGNSLQVQLELGLTHNLEMALFQGFKPGDTLFNMEYGLIDKRPWLLSAGFINWSLDRSGIQPFVEGGYYKGRNEWMLGSIHINDQFLGLAGWGYQYSDKLLLQADFEGGRGNFTTLGFTYSVTPAFTINPSLYLSNHDLRKTAAYVVFTWTTTLFKQKRKGT